MLSFAGALPGVIIRRLVRQIKGENSRGGEGPPRRRAGDIGSEEVEVEEKSQGGLWEMSGMELEQVFWEWRHTPLILPTPATLHSKRRDALAPLQRKTLAAL